MEGCYLGQLEHGPAPASLWHSQVGHSLLLYSSAAPLHVCLDLSELEPALSALEHPVLSPTLTISPIVLWLVSLLITDQTRAFITGSVLSSGPNVIIIFADVDSMLFCYCIAPVIILIMNTVKTARPAQAILQSCQCP